MKVAMLRARAREIQEQGHELLSHADALLLRVAALLARRPAPLSGIHVTDKAGIV